MVDTVGLQVPGEEDAAFMYEVYAETKRPELEALGWPEQQIETFIRMQYEVRERATSERYPVSETLLIRVADRYAGKITTALTNDELVLADIALLPPYRNRGIGTALIRSLQSAASDLDKPLRLQMVQGDPSETFYRRLGFTVQRNHFPYRSMEWRQSRPSMSAIG
jgi:GNAT superfamily N-acetyltransferase